MGGTLSAHGDRRVCRACGDATGCQGALGTPLPAVESQAEFELPRLVNYVNDLIAVRKPIPNPSPDFGGLQQTIGGFFNTPNANSNRVVGEVLAFGELLFQRLEGR